MSPRFFRSGERWNEYWRVAWMFDSLWKFVFLLLCTALVWLWRPDSRTNALTYAEQPSFDDSTLEEEKEKPDINKPSFAQDAYQRRGPHSFSIED